MRGDDLALATLAESVADGTPVDWQAAEIESARARRLASHLRLVDSIAALHRSIPGDEAAAAAAPPQPEARTPRGQRWGRLVLLEQIGSGTSCDVYRAWDAELHRDVALKLLHDEAGAARASTGQAALQSQAVEDGGLQARVLHEARRMARLRHEHVVQVYGAEQHDGRVGLWMELVRGTSLEDLVQQRGALGPSEAALIGLDVCSALAAVHGAGLLHRDVKAQNVMREDGGRIVLMDFGTGEELAGTNRLVGTPLYLAPEIFSGERGSVQSDVYALGVLLYYLVTAKFPVMATSMTELGRAHHRRERRPLRDLRPDAPQAFVGVVERALDSDPARRYRSIGELEWALRESLVPQQRPRIEDKRSEPAVVRGPARHARWRPSLPAAIVAAIVLLLIAVALIVWTRNGAAIDNRPRRIAVLPFRADTSAAGAPYLADRLTDELITTLGHIKSFQVPSLSTVLPFKDSPAPHQQIGRSLQVDNLLDATLFVIPNAAGKPERVRVRARLLTAGTGGEIWKQEFERSLGEMRALHAEIANGIVGAMGVTLTPEETSKLRSPRATVPAANDAYYLGLHLLSQSSVDAEAVAAFRRAIEIDPAHAGAHAGLARGLMSLGFIGTMTHNAARATAAAELRRALELDPDSAEAYAVEADLQFFYDWDWTRADQSYRRAIDLNPSFARARSQYARFLAAAGRPSEAAWQAQKGVELEPTSASAVSTRAMIEYYSRDFPAALASADQAIRLEPQSGSAHFVRARVLAAMSDVQGAIQTMERAIQLRGKDAPTSWRAHLLRLRAQAGEQAQARAELEALIDSVKDARQVLYPTHIAYVHEALGDPEAAIQLIERAATDRDPDVLWLNVDPRVDGLRTDPRFMQVLKGLNIPQ